MARQGYNTLQPPFLGRFAVILSGINKTKGSIWTVITNKRQQLKGSFSTNYKARQTSGLARPSSVMHTVFCKWLARQTSEQLVETTVIADGGKL